MKNPPPGVKPPYGRLSAFYFAYFAALGVFVPYWTVYLKNIAGFSPAQIGELMAVFMATKIVAPFIWGWLADHTGERLRIIRIASLLAVVCFAGVYWQHSFGWMAVVMVGFGFFWNASLPQFEALTLNHLGSHIGRYSRIRLWGSVGFIVTVATLPAVLERYGVAVVMDALLLLFVGIWLSTGLVQDKPHAEQSIAASRLREVLRHPAVWVLLLACALQQASHGAYYTFFSIYLEDHGYSRQVTGWMWALGVMAEVGLFVVMHRLIGRFGAAHLFVWALLLTALRWVVLGTWADNGVVLMVSQLFHAATYGLFHASAIHLIHHQFPGKLQGRGQALYSGLSYGVGGALGSLFSGYVWEYWGAVNTFYAAAALAAGAWLLALIYVREEAHVIHR
ncbi:MFS transporter, PPP family, 3-phenylpropionic acid transporter [Thiothrix caldifontis]|uniref:MFS transporter, PPP family, 3-phenylpropionic acid transporter n=1 Tax=Thiothrix caldifontis TaxID=525918 RepID=A0A1H4D8Q6_9GAMM|nr:MFS transporter [Thiothrix caldifontis]SEA69173.1 MFS transporter, PPP family, 3-phenylpropionic acid transporter [Thiothrix caldifontis]